MILPVTPDRGPYGLGRARTWDWPASVTEATPGQLRSAAVDAVVLQRPEEFWLASQWLGRTPGRDVPAVYVEHDTPPGPAVATLHPMRGVPGIRIVHVTHFNQLYWDCGSTPTVVIEHGIPDPGARWTGDICRAGVVINDPLSRSRTAGTDLLAGFAAVAPVDVFGMRVTGLGSTLAIPPDRCAEIDDLPQDRMLTALARRRAYVHPFRWTSLGLSLIEAMQLAMPVVVLAATEAPLAVPARAGCLSTSPAELHAALSRLMRDPAAAAAAGAVAREAACARYGLKRFIEDWNQVLTEAAA